MPSLLGFRMLEQWQPLTPISWLLQRCGRSTCPIDLYPGYTVRDHLDAEIDLEGMLLEFHADPDSLARRSSVQIVLLFWS